MVFQSLSEAFGLLKSTPALWITGLVSGIFSGFFILISSFAGSFLGEKLMIAGLLIMPLLIGGTYTTVKSGQTGISAYFKEGLKNYFRILIPSVLIYSVAILTALFVMLPLQILGIEVSLNLVFMVMMGVIVPIVFFTFFYDTAVVFEDCNVFNSIKRSIEFVLVKFVSVLGFFFIMIFIAVVIFAGAMILWSAVLAGQLDPITTMSQTELEAFAMNPGELFALIGEFGMYVTALIYMVSVAIFINILYTFKAVFYRRYAPSSTISQVIAETTEMGEYDEKGRWYKYG